MGDSYEAIKTALEATYPKLGAGTGVGSRSRPRPRRRCRVDRRHGLCWEGAQDAPLVQGPHGDETSCLIISSRIKGVAPIGYYMSPPSLELLIFTASIRKKK